MLSYSDIVDAIGWKAPNSAQTKNSGVFSYRTTLSDYLKALDDDLKEISSAFDGSGDSGGRQSDTQSIA